MNIITKKDIKIVLTIILFLGSILTNVFSIINRKEKITDLSWYRNFYEENEKFVGREQVFKPSGCITNRFTGKDEITTDSGFLGTLRYRFSYDTNEIKKYKEYEKKSLVIFSTHYMEFYSLKNQKKGGAIEVKIFEEIEVYKKRYLQIISKSYSIVDKNFTYSINYELLSNFPIYNKSVSGIMYRQDKIDLPPDQLPEELKNIDYKTKIDEIDKLLEERWNKACNPKALK